MVTDLESLSMDTFVWWFLWEQISRSFVRIVCQYPLRLFLTTAVREKHGWGIKTELSIDNMYGQWYDGSTNRGIVCNKVSSCLLDS